MFDHSQMTHKMTIMYDYGPPSKINKVVDHSIQDYTGGSTIAQLETAWSRSDQFDVQFNIMH